MRAATAMIATAMAGLLASGCDPVTMGVTAGAGLAANSLFGDSKITQVAREAYVRAPICSARPNGIPNGRIALLVRDIGWYSYYPLPDGRSVTADSGKALVAVEYEIDNPGDVPVLVNPGRALLTDADGNVAQEVAGAGGLRAGKVSLDDDTLLPANESWRMLSVFEVPTGEYALLVPSGRTTEQDNPHRLAGCRFPGPTAGR